MGQAEQFDCSGFVIHAISNVLGHDAASWPRELRHSRQMWQDAGSYTQGFEPAEMQAGSLLVMRRVWNCADGQVRFVPAHVGIVTDFAADGTPVLLHAQAGCGAVIERPMKTTENVMGAIRFTEAAVHSGRLALLKIEC